MSENTVVENEDKFSYGDIIGMSIFGLIITVMMIYSISIGAINLIVYAFGYDNFDIYSSGKGEFEAFLPVMALFSLFLMGCTCCFNKALKVYFTWLFVILCGTVSVIFYQSHGLTFEQYSYQESLGKFEATFLDNNAGVLNSDHSDMVAFYHYKNNPTLDKSERQEYFKVLKNDDKILKKLSQFTTVYNMDNFATYFVSPRTMEKFFMTYADVSDPQLKVMMTKMLKENSVKTTDYIAFHTLYRQQFISKNLFVSNTDSIFIDDSRRMASASEVSSMIHFFDGIHDPKMNKIKGSLVGLLSQPKVTEKSIAEFRTQLTQTLKSDPNLYTLMSKL